MVFTVAAWNMNQRPSSWHHLGALRAAYDVDAFLLQEARRPGEVIPWKTFPDSAETDAWRISVPSEVPRRTYASAIAVPESEGHRLHPKLPVPLHGPSYGTLAASHPGQFAVAELERSDDATDVVTLVSLYGVWDRMTARAGDIYADATLHRAISDLTVIFADRSRKQILVGGDLNVWHAYAADAPIRNWGDSWARRFQSVFDRLAGLGLDLIGPFREEGIAVLERCPCDTPECRHVNTYRHQRKEKAVPYQNDFLFASAALRERLQGCFAVEDADVWDHSDHRPVVAQFE